MQPPVKEEAKRPVTTKPKPGQRRQQVINLAGDVESTKIPKKNLAKPSARGASGGKQKRGTGETANPEEREVPKKPDSPAPPEEKEVPKKPDSPPPASTDNRVPPSPEEPPKETEEEEQDEDIPIPSYAPTESEGEDLTNMEQELLLFLERRGKSSNDIHLPLGGDPGWTNKKRASSSPAQLREILTTWAGAGLADLSSTAVVVMLLTKNLPWHELETAIATVDLFNV
jgi:hypothetical protein